VISRRLLYLDTQRLTAYAWRHGKLSAEGVFEMRPEEYPRFTAYLAAHPNSQFRMLANVGEEGHELETIPFLQGADRKALITRKLGQHFQGSPLATAISLGYEKDKRKNEKLLLSALTNPAHFDPWLKCLNDAGAALAGIYTVAQMGGQLLKKLGKPTARSLLLTYQDHSIRESYLVDGQPLFSRMTPLFDSSIAGIASRFATEAAKIYQYLDGQRHIGRNDRLPVYILAHPQAIPAVRQTCIDSSNLDFEILDSHQAARKLDLKTLPSDSSSELLYLHLLATEPPRQQFAAESHRHDYHVSQIRYGLLGIGAVALLGGTLFAAKQLYDTWSLRQETQALVGQRSRPDLALPGNLGNLPATRDRQRNPAPRHRPPERIAQATTSSRRCLPPGEPRPRRRADRSSRRHRMAFRRRRAGRQPTRIRQSRYPAQRQQRNDHAARPDSSRSGRHPEANAGHLRAFCRVIARRPQQ